MESFNVYLYKSQTDWLRKTGNKGSEHVRQATEVYRRYCTGVKLPNGYEHARQITETTGAVSIEKQRFCARLCEEQIQWLKSNGQASETLRYALGVYIAWREMGYKTQIRHAETRTLERSGPSRKRSFVRLRKDHVEKLQESGVNGSEMVRKAVDLYVARFPSEEYRQIRNEILVDPGGDVTYEVRFDPMVSKVLASLNGTISATVRRALDVYFIWEYLQ